MKITKQEALAKIEELKKFVEDNNKKEVGIAIKNRWTGDIIFQSTKTTYKEAIEEKGDLNLSDADLSDADLSGSNLRDADLSDADLSGSNLRDANLSYADLSDADLSGANLHDANLSYANLSYADLRGSNLSDANLIYANLSYADLSGAEMMMSKFYGKGGSRKLTKKQVPDFLLALGFVIKD